VSASQPGEHHKVGVKLDASEAPECVLDEFRLSLPVSRR
jgi:hypothetical protein